MLQWSILVPLGMFPILIWMYNNLGVERGALVVRLAPDGPAEAAGIEAGDVITKLGGEDVKHLDDFDEVLFGRGAGAPVAR